MHVARDLILCLDLASIVGWALFTTDGHLFASGVWEIDDGEHEGDRWSNFRTELAKFLAKYSDRLCGIAMERPILYGITGRDWTSARVLFGQSAIVELEATRWQLPTVMVPPSEIKKLVTDNGNAPKALVTKAIEQQTGPLSTKPGGKNKTERAHRDKARSDEADARGVGLVVIVKYSMSALRERRFEEVSRVD